MGLFSSVGGLVGSAFGPVGTAVGGFAGDLFERNWAKDDSKQAFERNIAAWSMNNAYNDPAQQMMRLKAAGLNPNLVYGSGSVAGNTSGAATSAPMSRSSKLSVGDQILQGQQLLANEATIENTRAEVNLRRAATRKTNAEANLASREDAFYSALERFLGDFSSKSGVSATGKTADYVAKNGPRSFLNGLKNLFTMRVSRR